ATPPETLSTGTQTMCISECTSMPAAWGMEQGQTGSVLVCRRRNPLHRSGFLGRTLVRAHGIGYLLNEEMKTTDVSQEGNGGIAVSPTGSTQRDVASHQWQGRRLSGQVA